MSSLPADRRVQMQQRERAFIAAFLATLPADGWSGTSAALRTAMLAFHGTYPHRHGVGVAVYVAKWLREHADGVQAAGWRLQLVKVTAGQRITLVRAKGVKLQHCDGSRSSPRAAGAAEVPKPPRRGFACVHCGHDRTSVRRTTPRGGNLTRERLCAKCGKRTITREVAAGSAISITSLLREAELLPSPTPQSPKVAIGDANE